MSKTIGRPELAEALAARTGLSNAKAVDAINGLLDDIKTNLKKGNRVTIVGFGSFLTRKRAARAGRNPATGDKIKIKASTVPAFKAGAGLKAAVNKK